MARVAFERAGAVFVAGLARLTGARARVLASFLVARAVDANVARVARVILEAHLARVALGHCQAHTAEALHADVTGVAVGAAFLGMGAQQQISYT